MLSEKIKELRKKNGMTQEELAEKLNVSRQAITKWETGEGTPDIENIKNISLFFHVSVDYLIGTKSEEMMSLKNKFYVVELMLFFLGICLGIVTKSWEFGFVSCFFMPAIVMGISDIVLSKKYEKENNIQEQRKLQKGKLPRNFFGIILNTNPSAKGKRIKSYFLTALIDISTLELLKLVATLFGEDEFILLDLGILSNVVLNNIICYIIGFLIGLSIFFILEYVTGELKVRKYNKSFK